MQHRGGLNRNESGIVMMFVLMAILLVGAVTLSVMQILTADVTGGVEQLEADQVFNIAQAGVHYAIGQLQLSNAAKYTGGTLPVMDGSMTLGTATITVNCIDTTPTNNWTPPCKSSAYPGYRRIISTGTLPVSGPTRTLVAVVQGTQQGSTGYGLCALQSLEFEADSGDNPQIYSDVASNGNIALNPIEGVSYIRADTNVPPAFGGNARADGTITCSSGCSTQIQGQLSPGLSKPLCSAPPTPTFAPGTTAVTVPAGTLYPINCPPACTFGDITLQPGLTAGNSGNCKSYTNLQISATDPVNPTVINIKSLTMNGTCMAVSVVGGGKVDLRIGAQTGTGLNVQKGTNYIGIDDQGNALPASQLTVWVNSSCLPPGCSCSDGGGCAAYLADNLFVSATMIVPNGSIALNDVNGSVGKGPAGFSGAIMANQIQIWDAATVSSDTSGLVNLSTYMNFNTLLSWKDQ